MEILDYILRGNQSLFNLISKNNGKFILVLHKIRSTQFTIGDYEYYFAELGNHEFQKLTVPSLTKIIGNECFMGVIDIINNQ